MKKNVNLYFELAFILVIIQSYFIYFNISRHSFLNVITLIITTFLIFIKILSQKYKKKELISMMILVIVFLLICIKTGFTYYYIIFDILFIIAAKNSDTRKMIKIFYISNIILTTLVVILSIFGILQNLVIVNEIGNIHKIRNSFGFRHPNEFYLRIFMIMCAYSILKYEKFKLKNYILIALISLVMYFLTYSRTGLICTLIFILINIALRNKKIQNNNLSMFLLKNSYLIMLIVTMILTIMYSNNNSFAIKINEMLSNRIYLSDYYYKRYDITLLGNNIEYDLHRTLDSTYSFIIINLGVIYTLLSTLFTYKLIKKLFLKNNYKYVIPLVSIIIYSFCERTFIDIGFNFTILFYAFLLFEESELENEKKYQ